MYLRRKGRLCSQVKVHLIQSCILTTVTSSYQLVTPLCQLNADQ